MFDVYALEKWNTVQLHSKALFYQDAKFSSPTLNFYLKNFDYIWMECHFLFYILAVDLIVVRQSLYVALLYTGEKICLGNLSTLYLELMMHFA